MESLNIIGGVHMHNSTMVLDQTKKFDKSGGNTGSHRR